MHPVPARSYPCTLLRLFATSVSLYSFRCRDGKTRVLALDTDTLRMTELEDGADDNPFFCDAPTVDLCAMAGGTIVQAHPQVCRVVGRSICLAVWLCVRLSVVFIVVAFLFIYLLWRVFFNVLMSLELLFFCSFIFPGGEGGGAGGVALFFVLKKFLALSRYFVVQLFR